MPARRKLDQVLDEEFLDDIDEIDIEELRSRRQLAVDVEKELSYYRRLLHGRMDLLRFERRRRTGEESRSLIDSLVEILSDPSGGDGHDPRRTILDTDVPPLPDIGRREVDAVLGDDVLAKLDTVDDEGLASALEAVQAIESEISGKRHRVQQVADLLSTQIAERYRSGAAESVSP
ncbi:MAG: aerial mycelium formation protein [Acidimicrobiia bacterium]